MPSPDVQIVDDFAPESATLYSHLVETVPWQEHIKARKTASFGQPYNYCGITYANVPMHPSLLPIVDRLEARLGYRPNNCLLNFYESGASTMGFHFDSVAGLAPGTGVAIVSLGAERGITFRGREDKEDRHVFALRNGSLLYMSAEVQQHWTHAVLRQDNVGGRISLTFRLTEPPGEDEPSAPGVAPSSLTPP